MSKTNNFSIYNQTTREKNRRNIQKNANYTPIIKYIDDKKKVNYSQNHFVEPYNRNDLLFNFPKNIKSTKECLNGGTNISQRKKGKYFYSSINSNNNNLINKKENIINNNEIQPYNYFNRKSKYLRSNSLAYIKKRPNDLNKLQNSDILNNKISRNNFKTKGRCLSYTNMKNSLNILNYDIEENNLKENALKKNNFPESYPLPLNKEKKYNNVNPFMTKIQNKLLNKNIVCNSILNVVKKHLFLDKIIFFKNMKLVGKRNLYEVTFEEYKFLEELKALGVTNKKELNLLMKDIFISIKGSEGINKVEKEKNNS